MPQTEFWRKKQNDYRNKNFEKNAISEAENDGIWPKSNEPLTEFYLLTHFQWKRCTNLSETEVWHIKKMRTEMKIIKKCHFGDRND